MSETVRLYHFVNAEYGIKNIRHRRLKIAFANQVNDVFELKPFDFGNGETRQKIRKAWGKQKDKHAMRQGFISFSKDWDIPTMWAHYADNHKGICLGFDLPVVWNGQTAHLDEIEYVPELRDMDERVLCDSIYNKEAIDFARKAKSIHWEYEKEWRIWSSLTTSEQQEKRDSPSKLFFMNFDENLVLKEVIFGHRTELSTCEVQRLMVPSDQVKFTTARPSFRKFGMVPQRRVKYQK